MRPLLALLALLVLAISGCDLIDGGPECREKCVKDWACPPGEPNRACENALAECIDDC